MNIPLLDPLEDSEAMIEPSKIMKPRNVPRVGVLCFFNDILKELERSNKIKKIEKLGSEIGINPVYEAQFNGVKVSLMHPGVGAPLAAGFLEEFIAIGVDSVIACGGAGVLDSSIQPGTVILPTSAIRDEGTSFHYLPPSREVSCDQKTLDILISVLEKHKIPFQKGKTWTTDAIYRETPKRIEKRKKEGCIAVEMECAAFYAVAKYRKIKFSQILYGGDDVGSEVWDFRDWSNLKSVREKLLWVSIEAATKL